MDIDFKAICQKAEEYKGQMAKFLRDMIAIPSESCQEKKVIQRIKEEMVKVGFDRVVIDPMGNIFGYIGVGKHLLAFDAHIDTVGIGDIKNWKYDPYKGAEEGRCHNRKRCFRSGRWNGIYGICRKNYKRP